MENTVPLCSNSSTRAVCASFLSSTVKADGTLLCSISAKSLHLRSVLMQAGACGPSKCKYYVLQYLGQYYCRANWCKILFPVAPAHPAPQLVLIAIAVIKWDKLCNDQCFRSELTVVLVFAFVGSFSWMGWMLSEHAPSRREGASLSLVSCSMIYSSRHMSVEEMLICAMEPRVSTWDEFVVVRVYGVERMIKVGK